MYGNCAIVGWGYGAGSASLSTSGNTGDMSWVYNEDYFQGKYLRTSSYNGYIANIKDSYTVLKDCEIIVSCTVGYGYNTGRYYSVFVNGVLNQKIYGLSDNTKQATSNKISLKAGDTIGIVHYWSSSAGWVSFAVWLQ